MKQVAIGDPAPEFTLTDQHGQPVSLSDFRGQHVVVLYFYPKDETTVCTREACGFRDAFQDFADAGAVVIGVSSDSPESHRAFAEHHRLPFLLLTDEGGSLQKSYGVSSTLGLLPGRVTFVIDKQGVVRHRFSSQMFAARHVREALEVVRELA